MASWALGRGPRGFVGRQLDGGTPQFALDFLNGLARRVGPNAAGPWGKDVVDRGIAAWILTG